MKTELPSGLVVVVKRDCPTCELVAPVLADLASRGALSIYSQDDPDFPEGLAVRDDRELELSYHHDIEAVPTLLRVEEGREVERTEGWHRGDWEKLTGLSGLGRDLPDWRPGCGSLSQLPEQRAALRARVRAELRLCTRRAGGEASELVRAAGAPPPPAPAAKYTVLGSSGAMAKPRQYEPPGNISPNFRCCQRLPRSGLRNIATCAMINTLPGAAALSLTP